MRHVRSSFIAIITVGFAFTAGAQQQPQVSGQPKGLEQFSPSSQSVAISPETLLLVEGPYTLKGSFSVFGYVIARNAGKATFKPCRDDAMEVDESLLEAVPAGCEDEAPEEGNPITVACADIPPVWSKAISNLLADVTTGEIGSVYVATSDGKAEKIATPNNDLTLPTFAEVKAIQPCGGVLTGFSGTGVPITGIAAVEPIDR